MSHRSYIIWELLSVIMRLLSVLTSKHSTARIRKDRTGKESRNWVSLDVKSVTVRCLPWKSRWKIHLPYCLTMPKRCVCIVIFTHFQSSSVRQCQDFPANKMILTRWNKKEKKMLTPIAPPPTNSLHRFVGARRNDSFLKKVRLHIEWCNKSATYLIRVTKCILCEPKRLPKLRLRRYRILTKSSTLKKRQLVNRC